MVHRLGFTDKKADTVHITRKGQAMQIKANHEIVLSAGAIGSPQILQLSGIGPGALLQEHGINVLHDASDVGTNLQDHLQIRTVYKTQPVSNTFCSVKAL